jgi:hypothetical protein
MKNVLLFIVALLLATTAATAKSQHSNRPELGQARCVVILR